MGIEIAIQNKSELLVRVNPIVRKVPYGLLSLGFISDTNELMIGDEQTVSLNVDC